MAYSAIEDTDVTALPLDDPARAEADRERAAELRQHAEAARAGAQTLVEDARAQAARLVADAETRARELASAANTAARQADEAEQHAALVDHARIRGEQAAEAEQDAADVAAERAELVDRVAALNGRLAELAEQAVDTAAAIEQARTAGDVDRLAEARTRAASLDEVTALVTGQQNAAQGRLNDIGEPGWNGLLDQSAGRCEAARKAYSDVLDQLDPERPGRREAALMAENMAALRAAGVPQGNAEAVAALMTMVTTRPEILEAMASAQSEPEERTVVRVAAGRRSAHITRG